MNPHANCGDQASSRRRGLWGKLVQTIKPNESDTIPVVQQQPHNMTKMIIRFVVILGIAVALLAFAWSR